MNDKPTMDERIETAVAKGLNAFWAAVVEQFPEAKGGNLDALAAIRHKDAATADVAKWVSLNVAEGDL